MRFLRAALGLALAVFMAAPAFARSEEGKYHEVGRSQIPLHYYQGMTHDEAGNRYFSGHIGLFRTDPTLKETGANYDVLAPVHATEGYNHIGDLDYFGGKLYLPLECYYFLPGVANTCKTGSIGVADPQTLQLEYYVKLNPAEISKAMWCEISPNGKLLWTQVGDDLLAYDMTQITAANAAPSAAPISAVQRLEGAVPPSGISGATFVGGRLFVAGGVNEDGRDNDGGEIWAIDLETGTSEFQGKINYIGESEGLDDDYDLKGDADQLPGALQYMVMPYNEEWYPTNGVTNGVVYHLDR